MNITEDVPQTTDSRSHHMHTPKPPRRKRVSKGTGTDAGLLTKTQTSLLPHFNSTTHIQYTHVATCKTTAFPFNGFIPKIDIMFIYTVYIYITFTYYQE